MDMGCNITDNSKARGCYATFKLWTKVRDGTVMGPG